MKLGLKSGLQRGVTLIELMVVITLAAVLTAVAIPSYQSILRSNRVAAEANALVGDLTLARSEAIKRGAKVTICPASANGANYQCNNTDKWQGGWAVIEGDNAALAPALRIQGSLQASFNSADQMTSNLNTSFITFDRYGFTSNAQAIALQGTGGAQAPCVVISLTGKIRSGNLATGAAISAANCQ